MTVRGAEALGGVSIEYRVLGPIDVRVDDAALYVGGPRERRSLVGLLLQANRVVTANRLMKIIWGDQPPATAATQIRNTITALRRHLGVAADGHVPITRVGGGYLMQVGERQLDANVFDDYVSRARSLAERGDVSAAAATLRTALSLWRGPALGGLGAPVLDAEADRLEEKRLACLERRIELDLELALHHDLAGELITVVHENPLRERLVELQMLCLYRTGRRQDALAAFTAARARLAEHLGLDHDPSLSACTGRSCGATRHWIWLPPTTMGRTAEPYCRPRRFPGSCPRQLCDWWGASLSRRRSSGHSRRRTPRHQR